MIAHPNAAAPLGILMAAVIALTAHENHLALKKAREKGWLPECILCPSCEDSIALTARQRRECKFECPTCGKDFEVDDETPG